MARQPEFQVLIVGAGPTGLLLAIWLKTLAPDLALQIIDKATGPGTTSRAIIVHARTVEFYRQLGLADALLSEAKQLHGIALRLRGKVMGELELTGTKGPSGSLTKSPVVLSYPQDRHERLLEAHLNTLGVQVQWNTGLTGLSDCDDHVEATLGGQTTRFSYVAGCDGAHSAVRKSLGLSMGGGTYPHMMCVADVVAKNITDPYKLGACLDLVNFGVFIPLDEAGNVRVYHAVTGDEGEHSTFEEMLPKIEQCTGLKIETVNWSSIYMVHHRVVESFQRGRCFILGDAAHLHTPIGGQGMNTGLGDASNLAWKLVDVLQGRASSEILDTYSVERTKFAKQLVATTDWGFTLVTQMTLLGYFVRCIILPLIMPLLSPLNIVRRRAFQTLSQIDLAYPHSPLSQGESGGLQAGTRLPWVNYGIDDNFSMLTPPRWQFHVYDRDDPEPSSWKGFLVRRLGFNDAAKAGGLTLGTLYFVRPDGYIGLICDGFDDDALIEYLAKWKLVSGHSEDDD